MPLRTKLQILLTLLASAVSLGWAWQLGAHGWLPFALLAAGVLASSGFKIQLFNSDGSISLSFPFVLLGLLELPPFQGMLLAAVSVAAVTRVRRFTPFTAVQIAFNTASAIIATACAYGCSFGLHRLGIASAPALALASVVYFLVNTGSVAAIITSSERQNPFPFWRAQFSWFLPFYVVGAILAATAHWLQTSYGWANALLLLPVTYALYRIYAGQVSRLQERQRYVEETEALQLRTIEGLAMAIEAKDQNTHDHLFRVRTYVQAIGDALKLDKLEMQALQTAAFLHDIGKLAVPEAIINKPGKLTPEEFEKMKIHPVVGADILERVRFPYPVVPIVRSHHEWWNGTGYPDGLKGEEIPIGARVLTVVDCYDALVSDRPYRKGMTAQQALAILRSMSGKQFDPRVVSVFEQYHAQNEAQTQKTAPAVFTPLNTEVEVWRGQAPGAGFEAGSVGKLSTPDPGAMDQGSPGSDPASLQAIAFAAQQAHLLFESHAAGATLTLEEVFAVMTSRLQRLIPHDLCMVYLQQKDVLLPRLCEGPQAYATEPEPIPLGEGISGWVAQSGKPLLNGNATVEPGCPTSPSGEPLLRSTLSVPLFNLRRQLSGVITLYSAQEEAFAPEHIRILQAIETKLSLALEEAPVQCALSKDDGQDSLTGLPNGHAAFLRLTADLERCGQLQIPLSVIVCDLNGFRDVNQRRGQITGDRVLAQLAEAFRQSCGDQHLVARISGDEFVFLLPGVSDGTAPDRISTLSSAVSAIARRSGMRLSAAFAASHFPADGSTAEQLLATAERRMRLEKQQFYAATLQPLPTADVDSLIACAE